MRYGATILDAEGLRLTSDEKALFRDMCPFGFILFGRNIEDADQVRALCDDFREAAGHDCLITIDQEGGRVQRLRPPLARQWRPALDHIFAAQDPIRAMYLRARLISHELEGLGINSNCAPVADVTVAETHPFLRNRCYGDTVEQVVALARATAQGHMDGAVWPVLKHMPGHGRAQQDSHLELPRITASQDILLENDFAAFSQLKDISMAMTCHLVFEAYDDRPTTLSPVMIDVIRNEIGFDGLIMTDDISMKALSGQPETIAAEAIQAGVDVVLLCNATLFERAAVADKVGAMTDQAQRRAEHVFAQRCTPAPLDIQAAEDELSALMGGQVYG